MAKPKQPAFLYHFAKLEDPRIVCKHYQTSLGYYCERMTNFADLR